MNEEVTPCAEPVVDGPKPPPPPTESLFKSNSLNSSEDLLPPLPPTTEVNLGSYNTQATDHVHMQESYTFHSELDLKKENDKLKTEVSRLKDLVQRLREQNTKLLNENTVLRTQLPGNHYHRTEELAKAETYNGMPIPEQSASTIRQSEMVPKGSGTY